MAYASMGLLKGPDIGMVAAKAAEALTKPIEMHAGNMKYTATARTDGEVRLLFVGLGVDGPKKYAELLSARGKYPALASLFPEDSVPRQMGQVRPLAEISRDESGQKSTLPVLNNSQENRYKNPYSLYARYARFAYNIKSAARATYSRAKTEITNAVAKVYNSGKKRLRGNDRPGNLEQMLVAPA
ncbi:hypothetical protein HY487_00345 [Candidatus Woesearchaeota archaeon]|nr:hypothetical protein [Candidatus Woesearchaeota archaeon]